MLFIEIYLIMWYLIEKTNDFPDLDTPIIVSDGKYYAMLFVESVLQVKDTPYCQWKYWTKIPELKINN